MYERPHGQVGKAYKAIGITLVAAVWICIGVTMALGAYREMTGHGYAGVMPGSMLRVK